MSSQEPSIPVDTEPQDAELYSSWALLILTTLLIITLLSSYFLQIKKIKIIHETVVSIFTGKNRSASN
jgi:sodium/hydrogen exchanger-like protein 6/7